MDEEATTQLTLADKLKQIEESGWPLAFDGCHKIYFLQDEGRERQARDFGYDIYPSTDLRKLWDASCFLRFVTRWGYDNDDFAHPLNIEQGEG
jgi:hypothetical protein